MNALRKLEAIFSFFFVIYLIKGNPANRPISPTSQSGHHTNTSSLDGDEYCRITIDSLTNSYKIDAPSKPRIISGRKVRSASHSLLTTQYMEGK